MQCEEIKNLICNRPTGAKIGSAILVTAIVSYIKFRPIALIVSSVYVTWIYKTFYPNYKFQISEELIVRCKDVYENAKDLRKHRPHVFCCFVSSILFLIAVAGHVIEGTYILLICLIAGVLITSKYEIKLIKENDSSSTSSSFASINMSIDDLVPKIDEAQSKILEQLGNHGGGANDGDECYSSPKSTQEDYHSDNELLPNVDEKDKNPERFFIDDKQTVLTTSAEYKRKHFSNTSSESSDSDDSITRGLEYKNIPVIATIEPQSSSHLLDDISFYSSTSSPQQMSAPIKKSSHLSKAMESEEEISDFEFLEKEDLNK